MELLMEWIRLAIDMVLNMDHYLNQWIVQFGPMIYVLFFLVIFCETGLVVTPFLPGDSFLFAIGALAASANSSLDLTTLLWSLTLAAILGDTVNYHCGKYVGPRIFQKEGGIFLNKKHLIAAQAFYEKHGGKTIIIARFAPIVRTFAPFVAGIGQMKYRLFLVYNVVGAVLWIWMFLIAGYYFGNLPQVQDNFHIVIFAIIILSLMPMVYEYLKAQRQKRLEQA